MKRKSGDCPYFWIAESKRLASDRNGRQIAAMVRIMTALAAFALFLSPGISLAKDKAPKPAKPALWVVKDKDTTIYLFGTIHALPKETVWRTAKFDAAVAASGELMVEVAELDDPIKIAPFYLQLATTPGLRPILDRVRPEKRKDVERAAQLVKIDLTELQHYESWLAANFFAEKMLKYIDIPTDYGVDRQIVATFKQRMLPVSGIETVEEQLGAFDTLSEKAQIFLLEGVTDELDNARAEYEELLHNWAVGDVKALKSSSEKEFDGQSELRDKLLIERNRRWADRLKARMQKAGTVFLAVGSGHLVGKDSVQNLLKARGIKSKRVQ
jgi:uncharacterized protein